MVGMWWLYSLSSVPVQSNNMVLDSILRYWRDPSRQDGVVAKGRPHVITSNLEHDSVIVCVRRWEKEGHIGELKQDISSYSCTNQSIW